MSIEYVGQPTIVTNETIVYVFSIGDNVTYSTNTLAQNVTITTK